MFLSKAEAGPLSVFYPPRHTDFLQCFTWRRDTDHPRCGKIIVATVQRGKKDKKSTGTMQTTATFVPRRLRNTNDHWRKERGTRLEANLSTRVSPQGNAPLGCRGLPPHGRRRGTPPPASPPAAHLGATHPTAAWRRAASPRALQRRMAPGGRQGRPEAAAP